MGYVLVKVGSVHWLRDCACRVEMNGSLSARSQGAE